MSFSRQDEQHYGTCRNCQRSEADHIRYEETIYNVQLKREVPTFNTVVLCPGTGFAESVEAVAKLLARYKVASPGYVAAKHLLTINPGKVAVAPVEYQDDEDEDWADEAGMNDYDED